MHLKKLDFLVLLVTVLVIGAFSVVAYQRHGQKKEVVVTSSGRQYIYALDDEEAAYAVPGLAGDTVIAIQNGTVRFVSSPCPHKVCIAKGAISHAGEWIACLPNGVVVQVNGNAGEAKTVDVISE